MKKTIFAILTLLWSFLAVSASSPIILGESNSATVIKGDVNADGTISLLDIMTVIDHILGNEPEDFVLEAADLNNDEDIGLADIMMIIDIILNGGVTGPSTDNGDANPSYPVLAPLK